MTGTDTLVLIVEDTEDNLLLIRRLLRKTGFRLIEAHDGRAAIDQARTHRPDLVLLDMSLPEVDGWTVARTLREMPETKTATIVALTAHAMDGDRQKALDAGCHHYMTKPIDVPSFLPTLTRILESRRG